MKLLHKERVGARLRRRYDAPRTPLERVLASPAVDPVRAVAFRRLREQLDPFALAQAIEQKLDRIYALAPPHHRPELAARAVPRLPVRRRAGKRLSIRPSPRGGWDPERPVTSRMAR